MIARPTVIEFIGSDAFLGRHFAGASWDRWRAVLEHADI